MKVYRIDYIYIIVKNWNQSSRLDSIMIEWLLQTSFGRHANMQCSRVVPKEAIQYQTLQSNNAPKEYS